MTIMFEKDRGRSKVRHHKRKARIDSKKVILWYLMGWEGNRPLWSCCCQAKRLIFYCQLMQLIQKRLELIN